MQSDVENRPSGPTEKKPRTLNLTRARVAWVSSARRVLDESDGRRGEGGRESPLQSRATASQKNIRIGTRRDAGWGFFCGELTEALPFFVSASRWRFLF